VPAPPFIPGALRVRYWFDLQSGFTGGVGGYYTYTGGPPSTTDANAICAKLRAEFSANLASFMSTAYALTQVTLRDLSSAIGSEGIDTTNVPGTDSNQSLPIDVCAIVNCHIGRNYRGGRPRQYWPFGTETSLLDNHTWTTAFVDALAAAVLTMNTALTGFTTGTTSIAANANVSLYGGFKVVTSPTTGRARNVPQYRGTPGFDPVIAPDPIVSYSVQKFLGSQRRRIRGTGT
jgi:hypothetical protein